MLSTPGGLWLPVAVLLPFVAALVGIGAGGRALPRVAFVAIVLGLGVAAAIAAAWLQTAGPLVYVLGGWTPPLGVALRADGPAVAMLLAVAVVVGVIAIYARADFEMPASGEARAPFSYWLLLLAVWGSLNLVFVSGDLFTLYVALELLTFAGVPLVCLAGSGETLRAALRYLLFALCGSLLYLLGAVLLYGGYGTLDIALLAERVTRGPIVWTACALMTVGLLAKTALFPLHIWLPPAHGGAPAAASAVLSALVVKGSWFLVLRLWFDVMPGVLSLAAAQLLAALGAAAIVVGSVVALCQQRLKLLVAYSTIAQLGYLFLMFPLAFEETAGPVRGVALTAGVLQAISHATAKAGMFMAAGSIYAALGHDRIDDLAGAARALPVAVSAFLLGGLALMGVVPSGAYLAKKLLLDAAEATGQWWWTALLEGAGAFTAAYVVLIFVRVLRRPAQPLRDVTRVSAVSQSAALALALASLLLGGVALWMPAGLIKNPLALAELGPTVTVFAAGALLAFGLAGRGSAHAGGAQTARDAVLAPLGRGFERFDRALRRWPVATAMLVLLTGAFAWLMMAA